MADQSSVFFLITLLVLLTILAIFGMKFVVAGRASRADALHSIEYRQLAEESSASQQEAAASLKAIEADLSDLRSRVTAIEGMLKEIG